MGSLAKGFLRKVCGNSAEKFAEICKEMRFIAPGKGAEILRKVCSASPKRGCLNVGAWKPQESGRKAPLSCNAAFSMLQCSFSFAAAQLLVQMTSALQKSQCCSAAPAAQHSESCSATSVFACGMLQGWGLEGSGLGPADLRKFRGNLRKIFCNDPLPERPHKLIAVLFASAFLPNMQERKPQRVLSKLGELAQIHRKTWALFKNRFGEV